MKHRRLLILLPTVLLFYNCGAAYTPSVYWDKAWPLLNETGGDWVKISDSPSDSLGKAIYELFYSTFTQRDTAWDIVQRLGTPDFIKFSEGKYAHAKAFYSNQTLRQRKLHVYHPSIGYVSEGLSYDFAKVYTQTGDEWAYEWTLKSVTPLMIPGMAEIADESKNVAVKDDGSVRTLAVMDFSGMGISGGEAQALTERLRVELFNEGSFKLLERGMMETILQEQGFQQTGCVDSECLVEVGKLIGVEWMVSGSISQVGNVLSVSAKIFSVGTGEIVGSATYDARGNIGDLMMGGMKRVARELSQY